MQHSLSLNGTKVNITLQRADLFMSRSKAIHFIRHFYQVELTDNEPKEFSVHLLQFVQNFAQICNN